MKLNVILQSFRLPFLVLTPVCVFLGVSSMISRNETVDLISVFLVFLGALSAHISVNALNEYADFRSGLDLQTRRTPFSGGSGALPGNPEMSHAVLAAGIVTLITTLIVGAFFIHKAGAGIFPIGVLGVLLIITYTTWINRSPYLCLVAPGVGFGFLMVAGTQYVLEGQFAPLSWLVAVVPFFLVNNLLLLNQYPDIQADRNAGRNHYPIAYGVRRSNQVYAVFALATVVAIVSYVWIGILPLLSLVALLPMPLAFYSLAGARKVGENIGEYPQYMSANVAVTILTPLLLGVSLVV